MADILHITGPVHVGAEEVRGEVWIVDGSITFERPLSDASVVTIRGHVLPGYVDAHCHVGLDGQGAVSDEVAEQQALADRDAGTLLIRDAAVPGDTRWMDERADLPKVIRAGRHIARTRRYVRNYAHEVEPDEVVAYVRAEARRGDGWVKLVGDWIDRDRGDLAPCWPDEVVAAAVAAAHEEGVRTTAHCFGEESLHQFAAAGSDCVEHASGLREDTIEAFAQRQIAIVPTLINIETFPSIAAAAGGKYPTYGAHMLDLHRRRFATIGAAHDAGIPIYNGTDAGGVLAHGLVAQEAALLVQAGMSTTESIAATTWAARAWLGRPGLEEGADADLVVLAEDPFADITALRSPRHILLRGALIR